MKANPQPLSNCAPNSPGDGSFSVSLAKKIYKSIKRLAARSPRLNQLMEADLLFRRHESWLRFAEPGHFYSPIPSPTDIARRTAAGEGARSLPGVAMRAAEQLGFLNELANDYQDVPFPEEPNADSRYHFQNDLFSYSDAIFLNLIIRHLKPKKILEVGAGYSSAAMLDTLDAAGMKETTLTLIEPYTERLRRLLRGSDGERCAIIESGVQEVPLEVFATLEKNDILFVDSSHVSKAGSDVNYLIFEVFPRLQPGVVIQVHDIMPDFDYPMAWLLEGRAWNEAYVLRAFLEFNEEFEILLHGSACIERHKDWFRERMPKCLKNTGASLWLRRKTRSCR